MNLPHHEQSNMIDRDPSFEAQTQAAEERLQALLGSTEVASAPILAELEGMQRLLEGCDQPSADTMERFHRLRERAFERLDRATQPFFDAIDDASDQVAAEAERRARHRS